MAKWGKPWSSGSLWGALSGDGADVVCELTEGRVLVQIDDTAGNRRFRDLLCIMAEPFGYFLDVADDVRAGFDLDTAVGEQLDLIGENVGLPRSGEDDEAYRTILTLQSTILQGQVDGDWTGTVNNLLELVRTFIGPTVNPIVYVALPPYSFSLVIPKTLSAGEAKVLFRFIRTSIYAAVLGLVIVIPDGDNLWDSDPGGIVAQAALWANEGGVQNVGIVPGIWSYVIAT